MDRASLRVLGILLLFFGAIAYVFVWGNNSLLKAEKFSGDRKELSYLSGELYSRNPLRVEGIPVLYKHFEVEAEYSEILYDDEEEKGETFREKIYEDKQHAKDLFLRTEENKDLNLLEFFEWESFIRSADKEYKDVSERVKRKSDKECLIHYEGRTISESLPDVVDGELERIVASIYYIPDGENVTLFLTPSKERLDRWVVTDVYKGTYQTAVKKIKKHRLIADIIWKILLLGGIGTIVASFFIKRKKKKISA